MALSKELWGRVRVSRLYLAGGSGATRRLASTPPQAHPQANGNSWLEAASLPESYSGGCALAALGQERAMLHDSAKGCFIVIIFGASC